MRANTAQLKILKMARSIPYSVILLILLFLGGLSMPVIAQDSPDSNDQEEVGEIEEVIITGSRIKRKEVSVNPVSAFDAELIEITGEASMAELLRDLPYNSQGSSFTQRVGYTSQASSDVNLRNMGLGRTLSLINGRRTVTGAMGFGATQSLTFLPYRVVERVEVLREGASAIYGADAIGGVVNVIFREEFDGTEFMAYTGRPDGGGEETTLSLITGLTGERSSIYVALERRENSELWKLERHYMSSQYSDLGFGFSGISNPPTYWVTDLLGDGSNVAGPSTAAPLCPSDRIRSTGAVGTECRWPLSDMEQLIPENTTNSIFTRATWDVTDEFRLYGELFYSQQSSSGVNASRVAIYDVSMAADHPNNPTAGATPENPIAGVMQPSPVAFDLRPADDFMLQLDVDIDNTHTVFGGDWDSNAGRLSFYLQYSEQDAFSAYKNSVVWDKIYDAIEDGVINPFADQASQLSGWQSVGATGTRRAISTLNVYSLNWTADLPFWELPGGSIGYSVGYDYRKESLVEMCDPFTRTWSLSGAFCLERAKTTQKINALYGELIVPFTDRFELHYALRNDDYDVPDTSSLSHSLALRYDILENLAVRASYSEGFRAPNLYQISDATGKSYQQVVDALQCRQAGGDTNDPRCQPVTVLQTLRGGDNVEPEESETMMFGVAWMPTEWFRVSVDYWDIEVTNMIANVHNGMVLELEANGADLDQYGVSVTRDGDGNLVALTSGTANVPGISTNGIDIEASASWQTDSMGSFDSRIWVTHTLSYNRAPTPGEPIVDAIDHMSEWKGTWSNNWYFGVWRANLSYNFNAGYEALTPEEKASGAYGDIPDLGDFNTFDLSVTYTAPWNADISVGARNITDEDPPISRFLFTDNGYSSAEHNALGRVLWARYVQRFGYGN